MGEEPRKRRFQLSDTEPPSDHQDRSERYEKDSDSYRDRDRERERDRDDDRRERSEEGGREEKPRKKRSRWGAGEEKVNIPGMPTILPSTLTAEQQEIYIIHLRLEEIARKLRSGEVIPPDGERSPSPPPAYDAQGNRTNTREKRYRKKLEEEKNKLIELAMKKNPEFKPPTDYKKTKATEKVFIPQKEYPLVNFIGQLIGPRGNTLKKLEADCGGVKVFIRGKGSVREGKASGPVPGEDEELHCLISGDTEEQVKKAAQMIIESIETAKNVPEAQNEKKMNQLRELATLNGTLRLDEMRTCRNCGAQGHNARDCTERKNFTQTVLCTLCGNAGHFRRDCPMNSNPEFREQNKEMDQEYLSLMKELGEEIPNGGGPGGPNGPRTPTQNFPRRPFPGPGGPGGPGGFRPPRPAWGFGNQHWTPGSGSNNPWQGGGGNMPPGPPSLPLPGPPGMAPWQQGSNAPQGAPLSLPLPGASASPSSSPYPSAYPPNAGYPAAYPGYPGYAGYGYQPSPGGYNGYQNPYGAQGGAPGGAPLPPGQGQPPPPPGGEGEDQQPPKPSEDAPPPPPPPADGSQQQQPGSDPNQAWQGYQWDPNQYAQQQAYYGSWGAQGWQQQQY